MMLHVPVTQAMFDPLPTVWVQFWPVQFTLQPEPQVPGKVKPMEQFALHRARTGVEATTRILGTVAVCASAHGAAAPCSGQNEAQRNPQ